MDLLFFKGFLIGLSIAAPVGPVCILCIRQSSAFGFKGGLITGIAAALANALYTSISICGVTLIHGWIHDHIFWFNLLGGILLIYIAITIYRTDIKALKTPRTRKKMVAGFWYALLLAFMCPMTTFLFLSMFSSFGIFDMDLSGYAPIYLTIGLPLGSFSWWVLVAFTISRLYKRKPAISLARFINEKKHPFTRRIFTTIWPQLKHSPQLDLLEIVNRLSALLLGGYGLYNLTKLF